MLATSSELLLLLASNDPYEPKLFGEPSCWLRSVRQFGGWVTRMTSTRCVEHATFCQLRLTHNSL
jgi:hypothetical protein